MIMIFWILFCLESFAASFLFLTFCHIQSLNQSGIINTKQMCCCDQHQAEGIFPQREKICRKFIITNQEDLTRAFYVNISQFQVENQEIALCRILLSLSAKGLATNNRKFYMPKFNSIIEPKSFCRIKIFSLSERDVILKSYPVGKDNQQIFKENMEYEQPIVIFNPKAFKPVSTSGFEFYSMNEQKFNMTQTFNSNLQDSECPCLASNICIAVNSCLGNSCCAPWSSEGSCEEKPFLYCKRQTNDQIQNSLLYLQQEIKNQVFEPSPVKNEMIVEHEEENLSQQDHSQGKSTDKHEIKSEGKDQSKQEQKSLIKEEKKPKVTNAPTKRTRQPQRNIAEVILMTKIWRELHQSKSWSLIEAAKLVGISKKSLDDYFLILRQGDIYGYDFAGNLAHGMGELRSYLKEKEVKAAGKLQKTVECFRLVPQLNLDLLIEQYRSGQSVNLLP